MAPFSLLFFFFVVCLLSLLPAQEAEVPAQAQTLSPTSTTTTELSTPQTEIPPAANDQALLQLPAGNMEAVLALYQELTGREIILDASINSEVALRLVTREPLPPEQAARFIESTLLLNGFILIETADDNIYKLIVWTGDRPVRAEGIPLYGPGDIGLLPQGEEVVSYVMPLTHLDATSAAQLMTNVVQLHRYGSIAVSEPSNTLVITETAAVIRTLIDLQRYIDVPSAQTDTSWIQLERADAQRVSENITILLEARGNTRGVVPVNSGESTGSPSANNIAVLAVVPDTRTNRILLQGRPSDIIFYGEIIREFDKEANHSATFLRIPLRFVGVRDFLPVAAQALTRGNDQDVSTSAGEGDALQSLNESNRNNSSSGSRSIGGGSNLLVEQASLEEVADVSIPDAVVVGRTLIVADNQANAILVTGPPEQVAMIKEMAQQLDIRPRQVMLSTIIGQLNVDESQTLGVDLIRLADEEMFRGTDFIVAGQNVNGISNNIVDPLDLGELGSFPAVSGLNLYGRIGSNLNAYIHALSRDSLFQIVNRPTVFARNNERAVISSGQRIAIPSQTISSIDSGGDNFSTSIQYQDVTLELEIIPLINSDNEVTLQIRQINDTVAGTQSINGNEIPTISTQGLVTTVTVPDGATLVLGGLITEQTGTTASGIPILRNIPLIGGIFGSETETAQRQELMIFIQPQIINSSFDLREVNQAEMMRNSASESTLPLAENPRWEDLSPEHQQAIENWQASQAPQVTSDRIDDDEDDD